MFKFNRKRPMGLCFNFDEGMDNSGGGASFDDSGSSNPSDFQDSGDNQNYNENNPANQDNASFQNKNPENQDNKPSYQTVEDAVKDIEAKNQELERYKAITEKTAKTIESQKVIQEKTTTLTQQYNNEKFQLFSKYAPFSQNPNATTQEEFIASLSPMAAFQLAAEMKEFEGKYKSEFDKVESEAKAIENPLAGASAEVVKEHFEKNFQEDLNIPVVKEMVDLVVKDLTNEGQPLDYEILVSYKDSIKKIYDDGNKAGYDKGFKEGQLSAKNQNQTSRMQSGINNGGGNSAYSAENPPSLEAIRKMSTAEYAKVSKIVDKAMASGYYNQKG